MPIDVEFYLPFPTKLSPDAAAADTHVVQWVLDHGLLHGSAQAEYFSSMRLGTVAAYFYPDVRSDDLKLATEYIALVTVINDQVDSTGGQRAEQAIKICNDLVALLQHDHPNQPTTPCGAAWCDLWERLAEGTSAAWRARARRHNAQLFDAYVKHYIPRAIPTVEEYLEQRRITAGRAAFLDVAEGIGHFELPEPARTSPLIRDLLEEADKLIFLPHDVFCVEREEMRGDVHNMVLVMEHATGRPRAEVIADIQTMVHDTSERFLQLESRVPQLCTALALRPEDQTAVVTYIQAVRYLFRGAYDWQKLRTSRYDPPAVERAIASGYEDAPRAETASVPLPNTPGNIGPAQKVSCSFMIPQHIGLILDGNRRWSHQNATPPVDGYARGAAKVAELLDWCERASVQVVTLWALSVDNLKRPQAYQGELLQVITDGLWKLAATGRWCMRMIGCVELLPWPVVVELRKIAEETIHYRGLVVNVAIAYDGRQEITSAVRSLILDREGTGMSAAKIAETLTPEQITEHLYTAGQPDIDLVIRTSGEQRTSGFLPWQTTSAEFYFTPVLWPDFTENDFAAALASYQARQRRFGE